MIANKKFILVQQYMRLSNTDSLLEYYLLKGIKKYLIKASLVIMLILSSHSIVMAQGDNSDKRISLGLSSVEKAEFLSEMRQMLASIQGVITGIGEENRSLIIKSARHSGNRMARATPDSVRKKLPQSFKDIGGPTHLMFEELVIRAETDDMAMLASQTGKLMQQCLACHELFKTD